MGKIPLTPIIKIEEEKCINCYACITGCPVKYCMDGSGEKLTVNQDLCIGCGNCISACTHEARNIIDDTPHFIGDLKYGAKIIAIVAPAVASVFPEKFLNLNGWLKSMGVEAFFDVSFGAELTVISYLDYIKKREPKTVIAQPCPAIVNYIEIYCPNLLPYLAPSDSPMLHTARMIREFYPQYNNHKIAVISPCIAKRREFDETDVGDYNVTMLALKKHFKEQKIDISTFSQIEYMGPSAERAAGFSSPGGLLDTAERFVPGIRRKTHKIEGVHAIYPYLAEISKLINTYVELPLLIDCLNCEKGCNGGPGTGNTEEPMVLLESPIRKRKAKLEEYQKPRKGELTYKKYHKSLEKYWRKDLYNRSYRDLSANNTIREPNEEELAKIYHRLRKTGEGDLYNCTSCGYGSCHSMAVAIFNKLNKPDNCAHYIQDLLKNEMRTEELYHILSEHISNASSLIDEITKTVNNLDSSISMQTLSVEESSKKTEKMINSLQTTSEISRNKQENIKALIKTASRGQESMRETIQSVLEISQSVDGIASAIKIISAIAANTNLLSMNAAIESAHAGEAGRGFAVVANEIRRLSEDTRENSRNISQTLKNVVDGIDVTSKRSGDTDSRINEMSKEINGFAETMNGLINTFNELSSESNDIITTFDSLKEQSSSVKTGYSQMLSMIEKLRGAMVELNSLSKKKPSAVH